MTLLGTDLLWLSGGSVPKNTMGLHHVFIFPPLWEIGKEMRLSGVKKTAIGQTVGTESDVYPMCRTSKL
jgi:hypothetical protein